MDNDFLKKISEFYYATTLGIYIDEKIDYDNFSIAYSNNIKDLYCNFAFNLNIQNEQDFNEAFNDIKNEMKKVGRKPTFSITPLQTYLYTNKDTVLNKRFKIVSKEVWKIFDDFDSLENIKNNFNYKIKIEKTEDFEKFGQELYESFKGDDSDPYNGLDIEYINTLIRFNEKKSLVSFKNEFYFIKHNNEIIGTIASAYDNIFFDIHGFAIKKDYRKKGIGKTVLKEILKICKEKNKIAFIQTEKGYYPEKFYSNFGFKDICIDYYYQEQ